MDLVTPVEISATTPVCGTATCPHAVKITEQQPRAQVHCMRVGRKWPVSDLSTIPTQSFSRGAIPYNSALS
jgi:hypothetical protein